MLAVKVVLLVLCALDSLDAGHVSGREGKCEFENTHSALLGNVYSCKIQNAALAGNSERFTITGTHASRGRKDLSVKFVEFVNCNISHIPDQLFRKFPNLEYLNVNRSGLKNLNPIQNSSDLKTLLANNNQLTKLDANLFVATTDLETLSFRKNAIQEVDVLAFHNLGNLRELYLADNQIASLHMNVFSSLISLEILSLSGNQLQSIDLELFHANLQLHEILLYDNKLTAIHPQTFTSLANLFNLELHGNLCVSKDIRIDDDGEFQELIKNYLQVCFESYPSKE